MTHEEMWRALNAVVPSLEDEGSAPAGSILPDVQHYFAGVADPRMMCLESLSGADRAVLAACGVNATYVRRNLERAPAPRRLRSSRDVRRFQLDALRDRALHVWCPWTGRLLASRSSIPVTSDVTFYRFVGREVFWLATHHLGSGFVKGALYFAEPDIVVGLHLNVWGVRAEHVRMLKTLTVSAAPCVAAYLNDDRPRAGVVAACGDANYAHHLWNELSGLWRVSRGRRWHDVDELFVAREPLGPLDSIFPEIPAGKIRRFAVEHDPRREISAEIFREVVERRLFLVNVGDDYIADALCRRVQAAAVTLVARSVVERIRNVRARHSLLVLVTLRTGTRTWIDQAAGLGRVVADLKQKIPGLGVIVDGYSLAADYDDGRHPWLVPTEGERETIASELVVERELRAVLGPSVDVYSIVGCGLPEATLWVNDIDFAVTHAGSNQHKAGWLANKPTVVHSNEGVLRANREASYYSDARQFGVAPIFLDPVFVRDAGAVSTSPAAARGRSDLRSDLQNYTVDAEALSAVVGRVADSVLLRRQGLSVADRFASIRRHIVGTQRFRKVRSRVLASPILSSIRAIRGQLRARA